MESTRHVLYAAFICALMFIVATGIYYQLR
jgi:hypothetical protein